MWSPTTSRFIVWCATVTTAYGLALPAPAQTGGREPTTRPPAKARYWLRVTGDDVNVRNRPDTNSIIVTQVHQGDVLRGSGAQFGWHEIDPPPGTYSYVSARYIDRRGEDHGVVSVRSGKLRVRAGSPYQERKPADSDVQTLLPGGTPVRILSYEDGWFRIVPPASVRVYISGDYVERISAAEALAQRERVEPDRPERAGEAIDARDDARESPPVSPGETSEAEREAAPLPDKTDSPDLTGKWGRQLVAVEQDIKAEARQPVADQEWDTLAARLVPISKQCEEPLVARLATAWIDQLERYVARQEALRAAEEVLRRTERQRAQHEREQRRINQLRTGAPDVSGYDAEGQLLRSFVAGAPEGQRWYKLQNPLTRKVVAYLEFDERSKIDPETYLNEYVGIRGEQRFEPRLGKDVWRVLTLVREQPETQPTTQPASEDS